MLSNAHMMGHMVTPWAKRTEAARELQADIQAMSVEIADAGRAAMTAFVLVATVAVLALAVATAALVRSGGRP